MIHFSFLAIDTIDLRFLNSLEERIGKQETIVLNSVEELNLLLNLFGTSLSKDAMPKIEDVKNGWFISSSLYILDDEQFEILYQSWLQKTQRENNMDEYGQLLYLKEFAALLNCSKHKLVLEEQL